MATRNVEDIEIEKLAHGGDGLGYLPDGRVIFVEGAVPGDRVDVELIRDKDRWAKGRLTSVREPSEARQSVECDAFERGCGGCQFWQVGYEQELQWKVDAAHEAMKRISKVDLPEPRVFAAESVRDYRSRVTYHQRHTGSDLVRGFYEQGSRRVVTVEQCPVARPAIDEAVAELGGSLDLLGKADITVETTDDSTAVALIELTGGQKIKKGHLEELARRVEQGTAVRGVEIIDEHDDYYVIGDTTVAAEEVLAHPPVEGLRVESGRFRQANAAMNRRMVDEVTEIVESNWTEPRVVELFCGAGNFSFSLIEHAALLFGYEGSEGAVATARRIAELSEYHEVMRFEEADLTDREVVDQVLEEPFEVLVLDPPRQGAAEVAEQVVEHQRRGQMIYVSCDAACLARDIKTLTAGGWSVEQLLCFDMFPRTAHLEVVAVLDNTR